MEAHISEKSGEGNNFWKDMLTHITGCIDTVQISITDLYIINYFWFVYHLENEMRTTKYSVLMTVHQCQWLIESNSREKNHFHLFTYMYMYNTA